MEIKEAISLKNKEDRNKIENWIINNRINLESFEKNEIIDAISLCKNNLNNFISEIEKLEKFDNNKNYYLAKNKSSVKLLDFLVDKFNNDETENKFKFINKLVKFDTPKSFKTFSLHIDDFYFEYPVSFLIKLTTVNGIEKEIDIIPYNYIGLYSEYFNEEKNASLFNTSDYNPVFYSVIYNSETFSIGRRLDWREGREYTISDKIEINRENSGDICFIVKYIPSENAYESFVRESITHAELVVKDDFLNVSEKFYSKLVIE